MYLSYFQGSFGITPNSFRLSWGFHKRLLAALHKDYPALFVLVPIIAGQVAVLVTGGSLFFALGAGLVLVSLLRGGDIRQVLKLSPLAIGALSMLVCFPQAQTPPSPESPFVIRVESRIRYRAPGALEFEGSYSDAGGDISGGKSLFRGKDLPWRNSSLLREGSVFTARIKCKSITDAKDLFSYEMTLLRHGISSICDLVHVSTEISRTESAWNRLREISIARINKIGGPTENSGLLLSMLIGEPDTLAHRTDDAFKKTGLAHLLVVSGYQVTMLFYLTYQLLWSVLASSSRWTSALPVPFLCSAGSLFVAFSYACLTGFEGSVMRAFIALGIMVLTHTLERRKSFLHSIIVTLLVLSLAWPGSYLEPGTQLTFAALLGICLGGSQRGSFLHQYFLVTAAASVFTAVVCMWWFGYFSLFTLVLNPLLAAPVSVVVCKAGLAGLFLNVTGLDPFGFVLSVLLWFLGCFKSFILWCATLPCIGFEPSLWCKSLVSSVILALLVRLWVRRMTMYLLENGIRDSRPGAAER